MEGIRLENKRLYGMICAIQRNMSRQNSALFSGNGITPVQLHVLIMLHIAELRNNSVCQRDIENELSMRPSSVSCMLSNLEKSGFLVRNYAADNARTKIVTLTEVGRNICLDNMLMMKKCDDIIQSAITEEEQNALYNLLEKILKSITDNK